MKNTMEKKGRQFLFLFFHQFINITIIIIISLLLISLLFLGPEMKPTFFVQDKGRLAIRFAQVAGLLMIAYLLPFFGDIINVNILSFSTIIPLLFPLLAFGGFAFVATSILIPVVIHFLVFKQTMSTKQKMIHLLLGTASFLLMVVATYFSAASLVKNLLQ